MTKRFIILCGRLCLCLCVIVFSVLIQGRERGLNEKEIQDNSTTVNRTTEINELQVVDANTAECGEDIDMERELIRMLLKGYDKNVRPVKNKKEAISVAFDMSYSQLVDLDGKKQILTSKVWIRQFWKNTFLTWNETEYCGIHQIHLDPRLIWKPDIVLYNSIGISASGEMYKFDTMVNLYSDGSNEWFAPTEIKSICHIDIAYFPFDYQTCNLKFGSWTHTSASLNFTMKKEGEADTAMYFVNGEWELLGLPAKRNVVKYICCKEPFIDITYKIFLKRRVLFYLNNLVMPNLVLAGLVICSYYVPPESGERISLNITIMLGLTVFLLLFNERIPPSSEVVPLIGGYYFALFYQVGISMMFTCISSRCYHHNTFREMPRWFRFLIFRVLAPIFRVQNTLAKSTLLEKTWQPVDVKCKKPQKFLLYSSSTGTFKIKEDLDSESTASHSGHNNNQHSALEAKMEDISKQLEVFVDHLKRNEEVETKKDEWHFASMVLDKLFFWFFVFSILLTTLLFYAKIATQTPNTDGHQT